MSDRQLQAFFVHEARVGLSPGTVFGEGGCGFMRLNIAAPRHIIVEALDRIRLALNRSESRKGVAATAIHCSAGHRSQRVFANGLLLGETV